MDSRSVRVVGLLTLIGAVLLNPYVLAWIFPGFRTPLLAFENRVILFSAEIFLLVLGGACLRFSDRIGHSLRRNWKEYIARASLLLFSLIVCIFIADLLFNLLVPKMVIDDPKYGWDVPPFLERGYETEDTDGKVYTGTYRTFEHGFQRWGEIDTDRTKIFLIGDSFTETLYGEGVEYYAVLEEDMDVELFVKGIGGWGTLQQYLVLDEHIDEIDPDIVILQFTANDVINNDYAVESRIFSHNNRHLRPYWEDGAIVMRDPLKFPPPRFIENFRVIRYVILKIRNALFYADLQAGRTLDGVLSTQGVEHPEIAEAVRTTDELLGMFVDRAGDAEVYSFLVDGFTERGDLAVEQTYLELMEKHGITVIPGVQKAVRLRSTNETVYAGDGYHWNIVGNRIAGEVIRDFLRERAS